MKRLLYLIPLLLSLVASPAFAAAIAHTFVEQNTNQTTASTTYVDVTGASIASGSFTTGKKYLLYITAQANEDSTGVMRIKTVHGSTDFAESIFVGSVAGATHRQSYGFLTVWTAVAAEGVKLQFNVSAGNVNLDQIAMLAVNLSDDVVENTDWVFAELATDEPLGATPDDGASVTFTPGTAGHDWLVLSFSNIDSTDATIPMISRIERSGEASAVVPEARVVVGTAVFQSILLARAYNLGASSNTFKEVSAATGTAHTRLHSSIFVLNLNKFRNHTFAYTEADAALSATDYATLLQTASITPDVACDVWIVTYWGFDDNSISREAESRIQLDNVDQPAAQTTDNYQFIISNIDVTDEEPMFQQTLASLTAAAHTIDLDASSDSVTSAPAGQNNFIMAVTMELPAAGSRRAVSPILLGE